MYINITLLICMQVIYVLVPIMSGDKLAHETKSSLVRQPGSYTLHGKLKFFPHGFYIIMGPL